MAKNNLSPRVRRAALETLSRATLADIASKLDLSVKDRRSPASHVDAIVRSRSVDFGEVLGMLSRKELKVICGALGLDTTGKMKETLTERILNHSSGNPGDDKLTLAVQNKPARKKKTGHLGLKPRSKKTRSKSSGSKDVADYRYEAKRKNNPPAGLIDLDKPPTEPSKTYSYDPHLDPQLQWAGKAEHTSFEVDTVSLHIHERISSHAILKAAKREEAQRDLFAVMDLPESKLIDFYAHDVGWANRLILGDSLLVLNSLLEREQMAGKVQCIYVDPPYGVNYRSNFQPSISRRTVKEDDAGLTREPEMIHAYRDTWILGVHSYLTYLRDRIALSRELLSETGSIFVQISDENVHHVRELMDEVFGADNFCSLITFKKTAGLGTGGLASVSDYILWYGKNKSSLKYRPLYLPKKLVDDPDYVWIRNLSGEVRRLDRVERDAGRIPSGWKLFRHQIFLAAGRTESCIYPLEFEGEVFHPSAGRSWSTNRDGAARLANADRLIRRGSTVNYIRYFDDFPLKPITNLWDDSVSSSAMGKVYVVQTNTRIIKRCLLMTTDPGDLVFDPTCGSGTTAFVAEKWGRRWITCDTSRVALAIARQRLLTSKYPYFQLRTDRVRDGFLYKTVPHITLRSIAQNPKIDSCRTPEERDRIISDSADQDVLYDKPEEDKKKIRVSGPFTVEAIPVAAMEDPYSSPIEQLEPDAHDDDNARRGQGEGKIADAGGDYVSMMIDLLQKSGGVHFKGKKSMPLTSLRPTRSGNEWFHAESETGIEGDPRKVAVSFGPRHAPVTPKQVLEAISQTRGYDILLFVDVIISLEVLRQRSHGLHLGHDDVHLVHLRIAVLFFCTRLSISFLYCNLALLLFVVAHCW